MANGDTGDNGTPPFAFCLLAFWLLTFGFWLLAFGVLALNAGFGSAGEISPSFLLSM